MDLISASELRGYLDAAKRCLSDSEYLRVKGEMERGGYELHERIAIKMDSGIPEAAAVEQATEELAPRQREML